MNKEVPTTDNTLHDMIKLSAEETYRPYDGWTGFPGSGDGQDDLADYMALEDQGW